MMLAVMMIAGIPASAIAAQTKEFTVVLDAGHGGKDHGAIDNGVKEKDINLSVALRLGELIKKKLKNTKVVFTRDDDTFVSLQGRADIANKAKGDLFISIHTNSVDASNKNRRTVAGASVYTQGGHKDEANLAVARRENSVIELENGYEQKYSGFDPNKVESYIIFEMAAKHNIAQSHRFAKNVQQNLVKVAGRKDRGVHQAGFWVLWATSMPSCLVELDFICNPESAKFMGSKQGVDQLAEAIFNAVKDYEEDFRNKQKQISETNYKADSVEETYDDGGFADAVHAGVGTSHEVTDYVSETPQYAAVSRVPEADEKDLSHTNLQATRSQSRPRNAVDGRRRRSSAAANASAARNLTVNHIEVRQETSAELAMVEPESAAISTKSEEKSLTADNNNKKVEKKGKKANTAKTAKDRNKNEKSTKDWVAKVNKNAQAKESQKKSSKISSEFVAAKGSKDSGNSKNTKSNAKSKDTTVASGGNTSNSGNAHAGERKSIRRRN